MSKIYTIILVILFTAGGYFLGSSVFLSSGEKVDVVKIESGVTEKTKEEQKEETGDLRKNGSTFNKVFRFNSFHGQDLGGGGFEFEYPDSWKNDGQYFSPEKINHYDIVSVDAPVYYDLVSEAIIETSDLRHQITSYKKYQKEGKVMIDGKDFTVYYLLDNLDKNNRIVVYVGPKINIFGVNHVLVFRWEQKPLGVDIKGNDLKVFEQMAESLIFTK